MKATVYSSSGEKKGNMEMPKLFETKIREDLVFRYVEAEKFVLAQPYSHDPQGGRKHSASGIISHKRHDWKGHYGKGISRIPRKVMWRRGTQFFWIGAEVSGTRGGRRAHGPQLFKKLRKINKKEKKLAMDIAFAATVNSDKISERYSSLDKVDGIPWVIESLPEKTKDFLSTIKKVLGSEGFSVAVKKKSVRAGKGKLRGRKYKSNAGLLLVVGSDEDKRFKGVDVKSVSEVHVSDLYPLGRLTVYTEKALKELSGGKE